ncbi:Dbl homology domain-containing protein [Rhizopus microsporus]|uniref:Dynamin-binding protein n=1 Tax=Rhizopus microsporus TaxID=58291 RepID=A0A1X0S150_RHIZD|nr:Dbl homology domain-containing protein [Rhizopus microsporus]
MEEKALIEPPFHAIKSKLHKDTFTIIDNTFPKRHKITTENNHQQSWSSNNTLYKDYGTNKKNRTRSVPSSSSSPSLPLIKRSTTGTSISSTSSTMSTSSWAQWFSTPPSLPPIPSKKKPISPEKRARVIQELIETEKSYQSDMELVQEIYCDHGPLSKLEKKQVFINLTDIIMFEKEFTRSLCQIVGDDNNVGLLCQIFTNMMDPMERVYTEYCKRHEDALCKIQELSQSNDTKCQQDIQGRTTCWDLPSLLIKPVQRVLKYPLLLREILQLTPEYDVDYDQLVIVTSRMEQVADHINEIKKRKDIVEQLLVNDHKKKVKTKHFKHVPVHSLNKKWTRKVYLKKQHSVAGTQDALFDNIYQQFESRQESIKQFEKQALEWLIKIKESELVLKELLYSFGTQDNILIEQLLSQIAHDIASTETMIQISVCDRIESFLKLFKNPMHVIQKRNRKWIDYDRACHILSKGEVPDKQLQAEAEAYVSLNAHLLDELPIFLSLTSNYFDIVLDEFVGIQAFYWRQRQFAWRPLLRSAFDMKWTSIDSEHTAQISQVQRKLSVLLNDDEEYADEGPVMSWVDFLHEAKTKSSKDDIPYIPSIDDTQKGLFDEPVFRCTVLTDYETKEKLKIQKGDVIQVWLITSDNDEQWWYGSMDSHQYGWFPSSICKKL